MAANTIHKINGSTETTRVPAAANAREARIREITRNKAARRIRREPDGDVLTDMLGVADAPVTEAADD
jgi:hypothetical protein